MAHETISTNGAAIRRARWLAGFDVTGLANAAGITQGHLSNLEAGRRNGSPQVLKRIADATGKTVADFVSFETADAA